MVGVPSKSVFLSIFTKFVLLPSLTEDFFSLPNSVLIKVENWVVMSPWYFISGKIFLGTLKAKSLSGFDSFSDFSSASFFTGLVKGNGLKNIFYAIACKTQT